VRRIAALVLVLALVVGARAALSPELDRALHAIEGLPAVA